MKTLIFNESPQHVLEEGGELIHGGSGFTADDDRAEELLTQPNLNVSEAPEPLDLAAMSRRDLDDLAREHGIDPSELPNKDAVVAALTEQGCDQGQGQG